MVKLGVNVDHVATVRQARRAVEPDPVAAAVLAELAGADGITAHLREDRRHISDRDVEVLRKTIRTRFNLEMAATPEMVEIACLLKPDQVTLVPEKRQELTTEGGLDVENGISSLRGAIEKLKKNKIIVSLFIDPDEGQIKSSSVAGADFIELHTGAYADAQDQAKEFDRLLFAALFAHELGLGVNAGHGLTYWNVVPVARIPHMNELNIGHSIISRAVLVGLERAVREMKNLMV
ncbi:MAG TPA: pyridoxine 5'-phosphate synthase [Cyanobacteria bacterium UBA8530]|nr:pyridoxine 5'-phosphate synthase [Cyanobacteria bacterium UBA8530]